MSAPHPFRLSIAIPIYSEERVLPVYAVRQKRKESWLMKTCYAGFFTIIRELSELELREGSGDFALISRCVVDQMKSMPERHRYLRGLRSWVGYRQAGIAVERDARHSGDSKFSVRKLFLLASSTPPTGQCISQF